MAGWGTFLAVAVVLTVAVLFFARASQPLLTDSGETGPGGRDAAGTDEPTTRLAVDSEPGEHGRENQPVEAESLPTGEVANHLAENTTSGTGTESSRPPRPDNESPGEGGLGELSTGAVLANVAFTQGLVAAIVVGAGWYFSIPAAAFGIVGTPAVATAAGVGFGVVLWAGNELSTRAADAVGAAYDESVRQLLAPGSVGGWVSLFGAVLPLVALSEELLFRAALIGVPAAGYGLSPWLLAVVSSLAFAFAHGAQGRVGIVVTGSLGFVLAGGYILSGSLLLVVVAHYVINAVEFLVHELLADPR
ncbi:MAG: CPBP family intramembrane glutamic endopeptidase [Halovenus sp.]